MTLGNMRANGAQTLAVYCGGRYCHHQAIIDVSGYAEDVAVPRFGRRMGCTVCGVIGVDARPNWNERATVSLFGAKREHPCPLFQSLSTQSGYGRFQCFNALDQQANQAWGGCVLAVV